MKLNKAIRIGPGQAVSIDGYRGDGVARPVLVDKLDGEHLTVKCLVRSTGVVPVYRTYLMKYIDGLRPLVGPHD